MAMATTAMGPAKDEITVLEHATLKVISLRPACRSSLESENFHSLVYKVHDRKIMVDIHDICMYVGKVYQDISRLYSDRTSISFVQVPYELLNRKFRGIQKVYDRDISSASNTSSELAACAIKPTGATVIEISGLLDGVMQKVSSLKRRATECTEDELECSRLCKARLDHLKSYASGTCMNV